MTDAERIALMAHLRRDEGVRYSAYQDSLGYWTIGVGRLIDARLGDGLTPEEVDYLLANDIRDTEAEALQAWPWLARLDAVRRLVLLNMAFNLGVPKLKTFKATLAAVESGDYVKASEQMVKSKWAGQVGARAQRLARQMATGVLLLLLAVPVSAQGLLGELQALRAGYPTPMSKAQLGELLTRTVASAPTEWVLLRKLGGNNCPALNTLVSCDYIIHAQSGQGYDVLQDQEGQAIPTWNPGDRFTPADYVWVAFAPPVPAPTPTPVPGPPPVQTDLRPVLEAIDTLAGLLGDFQAQSGREHAQLQAQIEGLVLPPPVPVPPSPPAVTPPSDGSALGSVLTFSLKYLVPAIVTGLATWQATKADPVQE